MSAPNFAPAFTIIHDIIGNGHRAKRHARMNPPGRDAKYTTVHTALTDDQLDRHIAGDETYAAIIIGADGLVSGACIELDRDGLVGAGRVLAAAEKQQIVAFSQAVKGAAEHDGSHTWIMFAERVDPKAAAHLARQIAADAGYADAEIWPKGNAIRLPFGVHTHTQKRGRLLLQSGEVYDLDDADQFSMGAAAVAELPRNDAPPDPPKLEPKAITKSEKFSALGIGESLIARFNADHPLAALLPTREAKPRSTQEAPEYLTTAAAERRQKDAQRHRAETAAKQEQRREWLREMFPSIQFAIVGEPEDIGAARQLAKDDRYQFQWWVLSLIRARPLGGEAGSKTGKKGSDKGIDGIISFTDDASHKPKRALVQVKSGQVKSGDMRDLAGTVEREGAAMGVFLTLEKPSADMQREAVSAGHYRSPGWQRDYPKIQILTIAQLLGHHAEVKMPPTSGPFKQAKREAPAVEQHDMKW